jgi:hypothetical protein
MTIRRQKMANLAETAVYQAQSVELQNEKEEVKEEIDKAMTRSQNGGIFDEFAHKLVIIHERDLQSGLKRTRAGDFDSDEEEETRPGRQHFDAYPTADGLSRPYGAFPVFQPGAPSRQLRHFRKETLRPIEL